MHKEVYCQAESFDPCRPDVDSDDGRNLTSQSLQKLTEGVTSGNSKEELRRIISLEAKVAENSLREVELKTIRLLTEFQVALKSHSSKMEARASALDVDIHVSSLYFIFCEF